MVQRGFKPKSVFKDHSPVSDWELPKGRGCVPLLGLPRVDCLSHQTGGSEDQVRAALAFLRARPGWGRGGQASPTAHPSPGPSWTHHTPGRRGAHPTGAAGQPCCTSTWGLCPWRRRTMRGGWRMQTSLGECSSGCSAGVCGRKQGPSLVRWPTVLLYNPQFSG